MFKEDVTYFFPPMAEDISQILQNANCMFNEQNYKQAEELYTKFINSCLQSRYLLRFSRSQQRLSC